MAAPIHSISTSTEKDSTTSTSKLPEMERLSLSTPIEDLHSNQNLWYKLHVFLYDLRNFREVKESHDRLDKIADASYIGMPYFSAAEGEILKSTLITAPKATHSREKTTAKASGSREMEDESQKENLKDGKTLEMLIEEELNERLEKRIKKREGSGDFRVCAAHDIAPILEKAFEIDPKQLSKDKVFLDLMARSKLKLKDGDSWKGLPRKQFGKKGKRN